jgi:hypothetical protein
MSSSTTTTDGEAPQQPPEKGQEIFHLDVHAWIDSQHALHGVRHDDYEQYHGYCTRRLARLSHQKECKQYLIHSGKYATNKTTTSVTTKSSKSVSRHAFVSRSHDTFALKSNNDDDEEEENEGRSVIIVPHVNVLWYLLVSAERSWAYSNQLQKNASTVTVGKRQSVVKKLKRAIHWSSLLLKKAQTSCDGTTVKECLAYHSWMEGNYALEKLDYEVSKTHHKFVVQIVHCS